MKNVLIINIGKSFGGIEIHIGDIVKNIDKNKYNIYIVCRKNSLFSKYLFELNEICKVNIFECKISMKSIRATIKSVKKLINHNNISVVHAHGISSSFLFSIIKSRDTKFITTTHGYNCFDRMDRKKIIIKLFDIMEFYALRKSDICIAVSNDIKKYIINKKINSKKVVVINNGIYIKNNINNNTHMDRNGIIIKSLGRLEKIKGFDILINAIDLIVKNTDKKIVCEIAGEGKEKKFLEKIIRENNLELICKLVGFVDDSDKFLKDADIYVQPSLMESFGISILEAMNNHVPVIASNVGGIKDIIINGYNGILFESKNNEELSKKILYLINNSNEKNIIINNANKKLKEDFNIISKVKEIEEIYNI